METSIERKTPKDRGERVVVEIESASNPGLTYKVHLNPDHCPCDARYFHPSVSCRHITEARVRTAPYRIERRHSNLFGMEYVVVEQATGRVEGFYGSHYDAVRTLMDLSGIGRVA